MGMYGEVEAALGGMAVFDEDFPPVGELLRGRFGFGGMVFTCV